MKSRIALRAAGRLFAPLAALGLVARASAGMDPAVTEFQSEIRPLLETYCFDCHADGANKGNVAFDEFKSDHAILENRDLWFKALKNLRADMMPPAKKPQPSREQKDQIAHWIKTAVFDSDPLNPDPGRVTVRRLNRAEYHNTVHDLLGVDFDTQAEFPPDDTGYGFDTIGDVLTLSPMLLEKYLAAAERIVKETVPVVSRVISEHSVAGKRFHEGDGEASGKKIRGDSLSLSYYKAVTVSNIYDLEVTGKYQVGLDLMVTEKYVDNVFDTNRCRMIFRIDGREMMRHEYAWESGKPYHYDFDEDWQAGAHEFSLELEPLTPGAEPGRTLAIQLKSVTVRGPMAKENWVRPANYERFFPKAVPDDAPGRRAYARQLLGDFAAKAFRHPVDDKTRDRLATLAEGIYSQPGKPFEAGVAEGMIAVLASPRFIFREEKPEPGHDKDPYPMVDEYSLASRLSYFLWSSMPDAELIRLAGQGNLRKNLSAQVERMLKDKRSDALVKNFVGQWLRTRDIESVPIEARPVLAREAKADPEFERNRKRFRELNDKSDEGLTPAEKEELSKLREIVFKNRNRPMRADMTYDIRHAMRLETEDVVDYVLRGDRSLLELLDSDYTFLNEKLAKHYGIKDVTGDEMRRVTLPPESPRGGILTEGTALVVTSNPTRTSPVKRGLYVLDNILGTPPPPPPPDIPPLEDATKGVTNHTPSLRETLAAHRQSALCASCHNRMDPLGLALENFNAMGMWRTNEFGDPIDPTGKLITGEPFSDIKELKHVLVANHAEDFYRTITEKMLTYALGRGLEYYDVETVDQIVSRIEKANGRPSALIAGVVESAPFEKCRRQPLVSGITPAQNTRTLASKP